MERSNETTVTPDMLAKPPEQIFALITNWGELLEVYPSMEELRRFHGDMENAGNIRLCAYDIHPCGYYWYPDEPVQEGKPNGVWVKNETCSCENSE